MPEAATQNDLIQKVIENLTGLPTGQVAAPEDIAKVQTNLAPIIETLRNTEVYYLNDLDQIPSGALQPLSNVVAYALRTPFGVTDPDELNALKDAAAAGNAALKIMSRGRPTYQPLITEWV